MAPRIVEFQMVADAFLVGFGNRIRTADTCVSDSFGLPDSPCLGATMLDRVTFGDPSLLQSDAAGVVRLELPMTLVIVQVADLPVHGKASTPPCQTVEATVRFDVSIDVSGGVPSLRIVFAGVDAPDLTPTAATALAFIATGLFPASNQPFNLNQLGAVLGETPAVLQGRIAVTSSGTRMAIRFVLEGGDQLGEQDWSAFDGGAFKAPADKDWSVFLSGRLVERAVERRLKDGLEASEAGGKIDVEAWPSASLLAWLGLPMVTAAFEVEAIDACVCLWGEIDLDVDVTATLTFSVPEPGVLQTDLHLSWDLDNAEVVCCAFTAAMLWPFIGTHLLQEGDIGWGEFIGGLFILPVTFSVFIFAAHGTADEPIASGIPAEWEEISEGTHYRMRRNVALGPFGIDFRLESVAAQSGGLALAGSLTLPLKRNHPALSTTIFEFSHFPWAVENPCDDPADMIVATSAEVTASGVAPDNSVPYSSLVPLTVCDVRVLNDVFQQFTPFFVSTGAGASFTVPYEGLVPEYVAAPYPCRIQITTSAGVRVISLGTLSPISDRAVAALIEEAARVQIVKCNEWVHEDFWNAKLFLPKWLPDPPDLGRYYQHWQVVATGLTDREGVIVQSAAGEPLAKLISIASSPPTVEVLIELPAERGDRTGIGLQRSLTAGADLREVAIQQLALRRVGTVLVGTPVVGLCPVAGGRHTTFAAATAHGVAVYDLTVPAAARLIDFLPIDGLQGIVSARDGLLAWGEFGIRQLGARRGLREFLDRPVRGAAIDGSRVYILDDEALRIHDRHGRLLARADAAGTTSLAVSSRVVLAADGTGLRALDGTSLAPLGRVPARAATSLVPTRYGGARAAFFAKTDGRELVYAVTPRDGLIQVAEYSRRPLLAAAVRSGHTYATLSSDRRSIAVFVAGRSAIQRR